MTDIVAENLKLMISNREGGMQKLMCDESWGGNAGCYGGETAAFLRFFYDPRTGEIVHFSNPQDAPEYIRCGNYAQGYFYVIPRKIINYGYELGPYSERVSRVLGLSARFYNLSGKFGINFV